MSERATSLSFLLDTFESFGGKVKTERHKELRTKILIFWVVKRNLQLSKNRLLRMSDMGIRMQDYTLMM